MSPKKIIISLLTIFFSLLSLIGCDTQIEPTVSITANPQSIEYGESTTLSWYSKNTDNATIDQGIGSVATEGILEISPEQTTTYTISVQGKGGTAQDSVTVTVMISRTLTVEPLGKGSYAVGCSYFMPSDEYLQGQLNNPGYIAGSGGEAGEQMLYIDDVLEDTPGIHFSVTVPDDSITYGDAAGTEISYSGFMLYPTTQENPYSLQPPAIDVTTGFPHAETYMQGKNDVPVFAEDNKYYPLLVYSHGLGDSPIFKNLEVMEQLASHGYAVMALFHGDGRFASYETSSQPQDITLRPLSIKASVDYLETHPDYKSHIDFSKIGGWGGSYGGTTMFAVMGGKIIDKSSLTGGTFPNTVADIRFKAAVGISPYMGDTNFPTVMGYKSSIFGWRHDGAKDVEGPYLAVTGTNDERAIYNYTKEVLEAAKRDMYLVKCEGEGHALSEGALQDAVTWGLIFLNAYVIEDKNESQIFQQIVSVEGGSNDIFVEID
jgi:hypothetical protein